MCYRWHRSGIDKNLLHAHVKIKKVKIKVKNKNKNKTKTIASQGVLASLLFIIRAV